MITEFFDSLSKEDLRHLGQRGWRGSAAMQTSAGGSGVGLWIVGQIMLAHDGRMEVAPTDDSGYNEFRLVFPATAADGSTEDKQVDDDLNTA